MRHSVPAQHPTSSPSHNRPGIRESHRNRPALHCAQLSILQVWVALRGGINAAAPNFVPSESADFAAIKRCGARDHVKNAGLQYASATAPRVSAILANGPTERQCRSSWRVGRHTLLQNTAAVIRTNSAAFV